MKRVIILICMGLSMLFLCGTDTGLYGQMCTCINGQYPELKRYLQPNGWCDQSSYEYSCDHECDVCGYYDFMQCANSWGDWDPYSCTCNYTANPCDTITYWVFIGWEYADDYGYCADCHQACGDYGWIEYYHVWGIGHEYCGVWWYYYYDYGCWTDYTCTVNCYPWCI